MTTREASLAGRWYPGTADACRREIEEMMGPTPDRGALGGIVPHAGWMFSGAIAGRVFQALAAATPKPELVLLFGTHMAPTSAPHVSRASAFETPLGPLKADEELAADLAAQLKLRDDPADARWGGSDNTVEVQLPIIKSLLPDVALVVIGPPASRAAVEIGREAAKAARRRGVPLAVVGSTDLTHYGPNYGFAPKGYGPEALQWVREENDARLIEKALARDPEGVIAEAAAHHNACCPGAAAAAIAATTELGATESALLEYATSADVHAGASFVGYAAIALR
jgi:AmmeMemoRadiSam system protein B